MVFRTMKDGALAVGLRSFLNDRFKDYGEILDCEVDTDAARLRLRAQLKGETQPISAAIERYELFREHGEIFVVIKSLSSSREWLTRLLNKLLAGKRYKIPAAVAAML